MGFIGKGEMTRKHEALMKVLLVLVIFCSFVYFALADHAHDAKPHELKSCFYDINLEWSTHVGSSIVATPRIVDLLTNGLKDILIPTFSQYFEALSGLDGDEVVGFPYISPKFKSYSSPLPIDMDGDGTVDWLVGLYSGELLLLSENGEPRGTIRIPPLAVKKDWVKKKIPHEEAVHLRASQLPPDEDMLAEMLQVRTMLNLRAMPRNRQRNGRQGRFNHKPSTKVPYHTNKVRPATYNAASDIQDINELYDDSQTEGFSYSSSSTKGNSLSKEAKASKVLLMHPELYSSMSAEDESDNLKPLRSPIFTEAGHDEVEVDPHILSTPVVTDIDGNGDVDIVVHVSFFFDLDDYSDRNPLPPDITPSDYAATALMCFNLVTGELKWTKILHLTSTTDMHPAYAISSPLVLNADKEGTLEIFVTSTTGSIQGFNSSGGLLSGWPRYLGPITSSPVADDLNAKGFYHICAGDATGSVTCFAPNGTLLWSTKVQGAVADRVTFGDIDGDNQMEVVFGTSTGHLYALDGATGAVKKNFPIQTGGPIIAPPLLMNVQREMDGRLHIIVPSHDGYLYVVDGKGMCMESIDIDEKSSTMVLADDITGNGQMDLLVTTLHGGVFVFETQATFHPLKRWASKTKGINGATAGENGVGIYITAPFRMPRDVRGATFLLEIHIQDPSPEPKARYVVDIFIGPRIQVYHGVFTKPGKRLLKVRTPLQRMYGNVMVIMTTPGGQTYTDEFSLSFNMHYLEAVKFTLLLPFFLVCGALMMIKNHHKEEESDGQSTFWFQAP